MNNFYGNYGITKDQEMRPIFKAISDVDCEKIREIMEEKPYTLYEEQFNADPPHDTYPVAFACHVGNLTSLKVLFDYLDPFESWMMDELGRGLTHARTWGQEPIVAFLEKRMFGWTNGKGSPETDPRPIFEKLHPDYEKFHPPGTDPSPDFAKLYPRLKL